MEQAEFLGALNRLTGRDLVRINEALIARSKVEGAELDEWRVSLMIEKEVRRQKVSVVAGNAAQQAAASVRYVASQCGWKGDDERTLRVSRAAAEIARGITAGPEAEVPVKSLMIAFEASIARLHATRGDMGL